VPQRVDGDEVTADAPGDVGQLGNGGDDPQRLAALVDGRGVDPRAGLEGAGGDLHVPVRRVPPHRRVAGRVRWRRRVPGEDGPHPQEVRAGAELLRRVDLQRHRILERLRARDVVGHEADQSFVFPRGPAVGGEVEAHALGGPDRANVAPVSGVPLDRHDGLEPVELGVQADAADLLERLVPLRVDDDRDQL